MLYVQLSYLVNDTELNELIYSLSQKLIPNENDYLLLNKLLENNSALFKDSFVKMVDTLTQFL